MLNLFVFIRNIVQQICDALSLVIIVSICFYSFLISAFKFLYSLVRNPKPSRIKHSLRVESRDWTNEKISIIIALKNESRYIGKTLRNLESTTLDKNNVEIILVDGGCQDSSIDIAKASSGSIPIIYTDADRYSNMNSKGMALNAGFDLISGGIVLFLKADCLLPPGYDEIIRRTFRGNQSLWMAYFKLTIDKVVMNTHVGHHTIERVSSLKSKCISIIELFVNWRSGLLIFPVGSQGICVRADIFRQRKFHHGVMLEDVEFMQAMRYDIISTVRSPFSLLTMYKRCVQLDQKILSTATLPRYNHLGIAKYVFLEQVSIVMLNGLGCSIDTIYQLCYHTIPKYTRWVKL